MAVLSSRAVPFKSGSRLRFGAWGPTRAVVVLLWVCFLFQVVVNAQVKEIRRVLILDDLGVISSPGFAEIDRAISDTLQESPYQIELYYESLELTLFSDELYQRRFREQFIQKYSDRKPDVIITAGSASLNFIAELHKPFVRDTPIIFCTVLGGIPDRSSSPDMHFTGVLGRLHPEETLNAALRLLPRTKHVAVVGGMGPFDVKWEAIAKQSFRKYESKLEFIYLTNLTMPALLEHLRRLPSDTIVYHTAITVDAAGNRFIDSAQSVPLVASAANAPVFVMDDVDFRAGTVGGDLVNWADDARVAAEMAVRVLNGAKPQDISIVTSNNAYMFDWRALQRWGLKESNLPPGSVVLNREPNLWERGRKYFVVGIAVIFLQAISILALFRQRVRKRKTDAELAEAQRLAKLGGWRWDVATDTVTWSEELYRISGRDPNLPAPSYREHTKFYTAESWDRLRRAVEEALNSGAPYELDLEMVRTDGTKRWLFARGETQRDAQGRIVQLRGTVQDITERKQAEEILSTVGRRLIEAHEEERTWIARELHDDFSQRIAMVSVSLESLEGLSSSVAEAKSYAKEIREQVRELGSDIHALSHRLHSSKLDYLGLVSACKGFCTELSARQNIKIEFHFENIPQKLSKEISLCLFRVLQEALQNAVKYSGVPNFHVSLKGTSDEVELRVSDSGSGFDPDEAISRQGLGLTSMKERLKLVDGQLSIESRPGLGTTILARVPSTSDATTAGASETNDSGKTISPD
jgi:signal transduction histidine kinase/ABC-type uncharacterized transport system substrate-binding protein